MRWDPQQAAFRDQGSATLPAAPLVVTRLMQDQGVLVPDYELLVMPDDLRLGEFREAFVGRIGTWDRHPQQWRWARIPDRPGWQPLPEDHDQAFADHDGAVLDAIRPLRPQLVEFDEALPMRGLRQKAAALDAWLLAGLDAAQWEAEFEAFRARIDPERIAAALSALPLAWQRSAGPRLRELLRERLEALPEASREVYRRLARQPRWHGSKQADRLTITCHADGHVLVELVAAAPGRGAPRQRRRFESGETQLVVVDLYAGDDLIVRSGVSSCGVEVVVKRGTGSAPLQRGVPEA
jgi:hypothetical protein